jgi:hypothetical protein
MPKLLADDAFVLCGLNNLLKGSLRELGSHPWIAVAGTSLAETSVRTTARTASVQDTPGLAQSTPVV